LAYIFIVYNKLFIESFISVQL